MTREEESVFNVDETSTDKQETQSDVSHAFQLTKIIPRNFNCNADDSCSGPIRC